MGKSLDYKTYWPSDPLRLVVVNAVKICFGCVENTGARTGLFSLSVLLWQNVQSGKAEENGYRHLNYDANSNTNLNPNPTEHLQ